MVIIITCGLHYFRISHKINHVAINLYMFTDINSLIFAQLFFFSEYCPMLVE